MRFLFVHGWRDGFSLAEWCLRDVLTRSGDVVEALPLPSDASPLADELERIVSVLRPELVGFSCHAWSLPRVLRAARLVKALAPHARVVLGGPQVSSRQAAEGLLQREACIDYVVRGEGEEALRGLVGHLEDSRPADEVPGLSFRRGREVFHSGARAMAWARGPIFHPGNVRLAEVLDHAPVASYETSRGCRGSCVFCTYATQPRAELPVELVSSELAWICALRVRHLRICDARFGGSPARAKRILRDLARVNTGTSVKIHPDPRDADDEYLDLLEPAGAEITSIGVQSTQPRALSACRRPPVEAEVVAKILARFPRVPADVIVGLPGDDTAGVRRTIEDVLAMGFAELNLFRLHVFPGTPLSADPGLLGEGALCAPDGALVSAPGFPLAQQEDLARLLSASVVAAALHATRRLLGEKANGMLDTLGRIDPERLLRMERAVRSFQPAALIRSGPELLRAAEEAAGGAGTGLRIAVASDLADVIHRQGRDAGRIRFTWTADGRSREVQRVVFSGAERGDLVLDLRTAKLGVEGRTSPRFPTDLDLMLDPGLMPVGAGEVAA